MPHWELGTKYKLIDFDLGVKITGGRISGLSGDRVPGCSEH